MDNRFAKCLREKRIIPFTRGPMLVSKELKIALEDFNSAKQAFRLKNFKWATIQAYYSMFHSARALLYARKYREKSHYCLIEAIRQLYVDKGQLNFSLLEALQKAKILREDADYYGEYTKAAAQALLEKTKEFYSEARRILK